MSVNSSNGMIAIRAVTERMDFVQKAMLPRLENSIVPVVVHEDVNREGCFFSLKANYSTAMDAGVDWMVSLDDDMYPGRHFVEACIEVVRHVSTNINLYHNSVSIHKRTPGTTVTSSPWKLGQIWGGAMLYRMELVPAFLSWERETIPTDLNDPWWENAPHVYRKPEQRDVSYRETIYKHWDDWRWRLYMKETGQHMYTTAPAFVAHARSPSTITNRVSPYGMATCSCSPEQSLLDFDWSKVDR